MQKSVLVATLVSSLCLFATSGHAQLANDQASLSSESSANIAKVTHNKSTPIFYGTEGKLPFSQAVRAGNTLYMSGQIGIKDGELVKGGIKQETAQALDNINQTLLNYGYQSSDLVKCLVMLTDMDDFAAFNEVYKAKLTKPYPVRSAFGVADLALDSKVEIECMAVK